MKTGVLILSHERAERIATIKALRVAGYTGPYWIVVDDRDPQLDLYLRSHGRHVVTFSKAEYAARVDELFNPTHPLDTPLYARQAAWDIAADLGLDVFLLLDDDYIYFAYIVNDHRTKIPRYGPCIGQFDRIMHAFCSALASLPPQVVCLAFSQTGDNVGQRFVDHPVFLRKAMNAFFLMPSRCFDWLGIWNDDVCTVLHHTMHGKLFFTVPFVVLKQRKTQHSPGGLTRLYRDYGTYTKSFFPVMLAPSAAHVRHVPSVGRVHHKINWNAVAPRVVPGV